MIAQCSWVFKFNAVGAWPVRKAAVLCMQFFKYGFVTILCGQWEAELDWKSFPLNELQYCHRK